MQNNPVKINRMVEQAARISPDEIPDSAYKKALNLFIDTIACIFAGSRADGITALRKTLSFWGGTPHATVLGFGDKTCAPSAAFLNSAMGHARDYDDTHDLAANHGCVAVLPGLMAAAEACSKKRHSPMDGLFRRGNISGHEFIAALAVGLEVSNRLAMAFAPYLHVGWLPTTLWGPFGSAAACGRILNLSTDKMHHAFGLAYSQIHGNRQALLDGALAKRMQPAFSTSAGLQAAFMAAGGITASRKILSGNFGIPVLYANGNIDSGYLRDGLGSFEETMNISIKPYPSCRCTHAVIDTVLKIRQQENLACQDIESGVIYLPRVSMGQIGQQFAVRDNPTVDAQFSAQYTAALTFIHGRPKIQDFQAENVVDRSEVIQLAAKFTVEEFEEDSTAVDNAAMKVVVRDGRCINAKTDPAKGSPTNPLSDTEQNEKFEDCLNNAAWAFTAEEKARILSTVRRIGNFEDVAQFVDLLHDTAGKPSS